MNPCRAHRCNRRGSVLVAVLVFLLVGGMLILSMSQVIGRDSELAILRLEGLRSLYACEAATGLSTRELATGIDEDADGVIGSISDDGTDATDPLVGGASLSATAVQQVDDVAITARAKSRGPRRQLMVTASFPGVVAAWTEVDPDS
jgi:hypothetical protein